MSKKILIVEDNQSISDLIELYLSKEGYDCLQNYDGSNVVKIIDDEEVDMIILDLMLPVKNGIAIAKEIRKRCSLPIIMITACQEESDRIFGLDVGADDYITKPFSPKEMVARVNALFRRVNNRFNQLKRGNITVDFDSKEIWVGQKKVELAHNEFNLFKTLIMAPGRVFSRSQLIDVVYANDTEGVFDRAIDVCVARIRKKLHDNNRIMIESVRGFGYRFNEKKLS